MKLTLIGQTATIATRQIPLLMDYTSRPVHQDDSSELADLYFTVYPSADIEELALAVAEMEMTFADEFGELALELSPVVLFNCKIVSAIMTVKRAPWDHAPDGLFVIEVFTHPDHRRKGLAQFGLTHAAVTAAQQGDETMALRVKSENSGALALYRNLGFTEWKS